MENKFKVNKIPIDKNGNVVWFPNYLHKDEYTYIDNQHFNGWLTPIGYIKYGKQLKYKFETHDGSKIYEVFPEDVFEFMKHMNNGKIAGMFEYTCRGGYYGIKLVRASI